MLLKDKVIFLTGGSTGIGLDCATAYAAGKGKIWSDTKEVYFLR
jgi:NAD(P)-dependent dehydrogenase (short-subunit alcohol dehydrogenase family)